MVPTNIVLFRYLIAALIISLAEAVSQSTSITTGISSKSLNHLETNSSSFLFLYLAIDIILFLGTQ